MNRHAKAFRQLLAAFRKPEQVRLKAAFEYMQNRRRYSRTLSHAWQDDKLRRQEPPALQALAKASQQAFTRAAATLEQQRCDLSAHRKACQQNWSPHAPLQTQAKTRERA